MAKKRRRRSSRRAKRMKFLFSLVLIVLIILLGSVAAYLFETKTKVKVQNAGKQMTAYSTGESTAQLFMNGRWYEKRDLETLLVMGIDNFGSVSSSRSYNNTNQADFLVLFLKDKDTGECRAVHINRDTMTDITVLGVTGEEAGMRHAQIALAFNYGRGERDSSRNTAKAVSRLLYGMEIDRFITVTMDAVPIMNDWVGGVEIEVLDDFNGIDADLVEGNKVTLVGEQALTYVRTRKGLDDSSNLARMERQRQYASAWAKKAQDKLKDAEAVAELLTQMGDRHYSDCTAEEMLDFASSLSENVSMEIHPLPGEAVKGEQFMEYYIDEEKTQQLILSLFYKPV